jgi:hypothetical protein
VKESIAVSERKPIALKVPPAWERSMTVPAGSEYVAPSGPTVETEVRIVAVASEEDAF